MSLREDMLIETVRRKSMSDYLAIINTNGVGSWARGDNKQRTIENVIRMFRSDFKTILKPKEDKATVTVLVYDVEGYSEVCWDDMGMSGDGKKLDLVPEKVQHTYNKWK
jgi:hypothetical protein